MGARDHSRGFNIEVFNVTGVLTPHVLDQRMELLF